MNRQKKQVHDFWNTASCGEELYLEGTSRAAYSAQSAQRYALEPYILDFADFRSTSGQRVLEIGVGLGADHQRFAEAGAELYGVDLTERAIDHTARRFEVFGLTSQLRVADAEKLPFEDAFFDYVYSWGVLHHTPETARSIQEVRRVLKPGGRARVMIYHKWSMVGIMLWLRYALLGLHPTMPLDEIYSRFLESPGTKAYSIPAARRLFVGWSQVNISIVLSHADLLTSGAGQRHSGVVLSVARRLWPRAVLKQLFPRLGLFMLIGARK